MHGWGMTRTDSYFMIVTISTVGYGACARMAHALQRIFRVS